MKQGFLATEDPDGVNGQSQRAGRSFGGYLFLVCGQGRDGGDNRTRRSAAMRVRISDAVLLGDLTDFLETAECRVRKVGEATLDVSMPRAPSAEQAEREIDIYLKTWQAMHPGSYARIVSEGRPNSPAS